MISARSFAILCVGLLFAWEPYAIAQVPQHAVTPVRQSVTLLTPDELNSLVAPVALYPDPVLSQVLVASTYPVDIVEATRWLEENSQLSGKELAEAAAQEPWDASVQALVILPEVLKRLSSEIRWTTDLGNAFMAQEEDVMDAVQRMRQRASANGALHSTPQQTVRTITENNRPFIIIEPASPQVVYVPVYNPVAVWGPPVHPFPVISYPRSTGVATASAISFGAGMAVGSVWGGGWRGWGWNPGWGRRTIIVNNNFIRSNRFNRPNVGADNRWVRSSNRRGGRPGGQGASNRVNNTRPNNRASRPSVEQTQRRLNESRQRGGGAMRSSQANLGQGGGRAGQRSAARMRQAGPSESQRARRANVGERSAARMRQGVPSEGQRARRANVGERSAARIQQGRTQARQNRGESRRVNRGSGNRGASGGSGRSSAMRNRGSAQRSAGASRRGGGGSGGGGRRR